MTGDPGNYVHKPERTPLDARSFLSDWQKRYKITLGDVSEHIVQAMEEYAGQRQGEQAAYPDIERILGRVASHEITPAKAMELLQNWCDCGKDIAGEDLQQTPTTGRGPISPYPASDWE